MGDDTDAPKPLALRPAAPADAPAMAELLNAIIAVGGSTAHRTPFSAGGLEATYIRPSRRISCFVASAEGALLGFQALEWADPEWPAAYRRPEGWATIATYVGAAARGGGVGRALFAETVAAARAAGAAAIDATILAENTGGLAFYGGLGFTEYQRIDDRVRKRFDL